MSRRYSDQPINLIARIPSPEQMSAARPKQRSFSQLVVESGATCVRGLAEVVAQLRRLTGPSMNGSLDSRPSGRAGEQVVGMTESDSEMMTRLSDRSANGVVDRNAPVAPARSVPMGVESLSAQVSRSRVTSVAAVPLDEVLALRSELSAHQQEVARLSAQLQELKSLVGSQQHVLVYLGQELEAQQVPVLSAAAQAAPPAKKARVARAKSAPKAPSALRSASPEPSLNL